MPFTFPTSIINKNCKRRNNTAYHGRISFYPELVKGMLNPAFHCITWIRTEVYSKVDIIPWFKMGQISPELINNINFEERSSRILRQTIETTSSLYYFPCLIHSNITAQSCYCGFSYTRNAGYSKIHFYALKSYCSENNILLLPGESIKANKKRTNLQTFFQPGLIPGIIS